MIYYNQNLQNFQYKNPISYKPLIKITIASFIVMLISYLQIIENANIFGKDTPLNNLPHVFFSIGFVIFVIPNLIYLISHIRQKEIHADLNQGLIFIYKKNLFSEKKLIKQKQLSEYFSFEIIIMTKAKQNLILLVNKSSNLGFILGQFSFNNTENFDSDLFLEDLENFFYHNNNSYLNNSLI